MATTSQVHAILVQLVTDLAALPALSGLQIASAWLGADADKYEYLHFISVESDQEWQFVGRSTRNDSVTIAGGVWVMKPGGGETVIREARARAIAIWAAVETYLRSATGKNINGTVQYVQGSTFTLDQGSIPEGRYCMMETSITARVMLGPS